MELNYVIIVQREQTMECFGLFKDYKQAKQVMDEEPSRYGAEEDCIKVFVIPLQALYYPIEFKKEVEF